MHIEFEPIKNQKFEIGRTINLSKCDCKKCDFIHCPKNNYAVKMRRKSYTVEDFWRENGEKVCRINDVPKLKCNFPEKYEMRLSYDLLNDFMEFLNFTFPKGTYWSLGDSECNKDEDSTPIGEWIFRRISLVKFNRKGDEVCTGYISIQNPKIEEYDFTESQYRLAQKIRDALQKLKDLIIDHYKNTYSEWKIGWLDRTGRHYICEYGEHSAVAWEFGGELTLESLGWVRVALSDEDGWFGNRKMLTAEQRNWLSMNGYYIEE